MTIAEFTAPPRPTVQAPPAMPDSWWQWIAENRLRDCTVDSMLDTMTASGLDADVCRDAIARVERDPIFAAALRHRQVHRKLESVVGNLQRLWASDPNYGRIERRSNLSIEELLEKYVRGCRPVILTDLAKDWPALTRWTPAYFKERFGSNEIEIQSNRNADPKYEPNKDAHRARVRLDEFVDRVLSAGKTNDFYMVANNEVLRDPAFAPLFEDIGTLPSYFDQAQLAKMGSLWFGPAGTVTSLHHDGHMLFHTQVVGRKRWRFASPLETPNLYNFNLYYSPIVPSKPDLSRFPRFEHVTMVETILEPGETIFLPLAWWHEVTSLETSISFSFANVKFMNQFTYDNAQIDNWT
jgi:hypothetical protein